MKKWHEEMCWIIMKAYPRASQIKNWPQCPRELCIISAQWQITAWLDSYSRKISIYKHWTVFTIKKQIMDH